MVMASNLEKLRGIIASMSEGSAVAISRSSLVSLEREISGLRTAADKPSQPEAPRA